MVLAVAGGHRVSRWEDYWLHFLAYFSTDQTDILWGDEAIFCGVMKQFKLNVLMFLLSEV